jgi:hypothetical protein
MSDVSDGIYSKDEENESISSEEENDDIKPIIKREREYYEDSYLEFMRFKIPKYEDFVNFVSGELQAANYSITDHLSPLTKDTKCCLLNYLNIYDICRLARTCNGYALMTNNPKYDEYWRNRFNRAYPHCYVDNKGLFTYRKVQRSILWFDAYQYIAIKDSRASGRHNRKTFYTFVKWKRQSKFPQSFKNDIRTSRWSTKSQILDEIKLVVDTKLLTEIGFSKKTVKNNKKPNNKKPNDEKPNGNGSTEVLYKDLYNVIRIYAKKYMRSCISDEDITEIRNTYNSNIRKPPKCLINFDEGFLKKWSFELKNSYECKCELPYKSYYANRPMVTSDEIYDSSRFGDCVKQIINGPIVKPLYDELLKYEIDLYSHHQGYW